MTEDECYARCYGGPRTVEAKSLPRLRRRVSATLSGEEIRRLFEQRLEQREAA